MRKVSMRLVAAFVFGALLVGVWLGTSFAAGTAPSPGSDQDPLVTKSYVDGEITKLQTSLGSGSGSSSGDGAFIALQIVTVPAGQKLIGLEGTEFILRSGTGKIIGSGTNGVPDLTGATDLKNGAPIPTNHLLLFPRNDNRGFLATTQLIVMVRGRWIIQP